MKHLVLGLATGALLLGALGSSEASGITYTEKAVASGSLGGSSFTNANVTVSFTGDTGNVTGGSGFFSNTIGTGTVTVDGIGMGTFTATVDAFDNQAFNGGAYAGIGESSSASILDTENSAFATYDLKTDIGPVSGASFIRPDVTFATSAGGLNLTTAGDSTFTASPVPEASTLASFTLLLALGGVMVLRRKKAQTAA